MFVELMMVVVTLILLRRFVFKSRVQRLYDKLPGPRCYPVIGSLLEFSYPKEEITDTFKRLSFKYGPVYMLGLGPDKTVCLRSPSDVEVVLSSTTDIDKASMYSPLYPWLNQGLLTSGGDKWRRHRKILTPAFHFKILENFVPTFVKNSNILVNKLSGMVGKDINVMPIISLFSLDVICETAMGLEVNAQLKESKYINAVDEIVEIVSQCNFNILMRSFLFRFMKIGRRHDELVAYLHNVTETVMKERKDVLDAKTLQQGNNEATIDNDIGIKEKKVFLDLLLEYNKAGAGMSDLEIREEVDTFMFEGYDTTSSTLSFCLYCLSQNPDIQDIVYEEIRKIFGDSDRDCTYQDMQEMKYLEKVIKETLRQYPTVQFIARKLSQDLQLKSGYVIPEGTSVAVLIEAMNHDPELYPEPFKFDPDRFDTRNSSPYAFVPFSAGPRNCIGQKFAMLELKAAISHIMRKFRLLPCDLPIRPCFRIVLKSKTGIYLRFEPRTIA